MKSKNMEKLKDEIDHFYVSKEIVNRVREAKITTGRSIRHIVETAVSEYLKKINTPT